MILKPVKQTNRVRKKRKKINVCHELFVIAAIFSTFNRSVIQIAFHLPLLARWFFFANI